MDGKHQVSSHHLGEPRFAYVIEISNSLSETLKKLATLNHHQLAGHVANLSFWTEEVQHSLRVIDGCHLRFETMKAAQKKHARDHHTLAFSLANRHDQGNPVPSPKPVPDAQLKEARRALCEAFYKFIVRCHNAAILDERVVRHAAAPVGIGIGPQDLKC